MFLFYATVIVLFWLSWRILFTNHNSIRKKMQQITAKQSNLYERVDKRVAHEEFIQVQKDIKLYKKMHLISDETIKDLKGPLLTLGIMHPEVYVHTSIKAGLGKAIVGMMMLGFAIICDSFFMFMLKTDMSIAFDMIKLCGAVFVFLGVFEIINIKSVVATSIKTHVKQVEKDFNKLFFHLYPYYSSDTGNYRLADVLGKFNTGNPQMEILVNTIISDSKSSEELALKAVTLSYSSSVKIVDLASKLSKCISGNKLGPQYLRSMYDQLIAEEDRNRTIREEKKKEQYINIMMGTILATVMVSLIGTMIEMI